MIIYIIIPTLAKKSKGRAKLMIIYYHIYDCKKKLRNHKHVVELSWSFEEI
jgi:hypothetical protein